MRLAHPFEVDFVLQTVQILIRDHGVSLHAETLVNSDQGSYYTSHKFVRLLKDSGLRQSMSRRANCWDNAPQESLFGHMKDEIDLSKCQTHEHAAVLIDDWADYYNNDRYQWDLEKLSPNEYWQYICSGIYPLNRLPPLRTFQPVLDTGYRTTIMSAIATRGKDSTGF
jgi:transposase InsO family protein